MIDFNDVQQLVWGVVGFNIFLVILLVITTRQPRNCKCQKDEGKQ